MYELTILIVSLCGLLVSALLYRKASGEPVFMVNMLNYSFWVVCLTAFVGTFLAVLDGANPGLVEGEHFGDQANRFIVWSMALWALLGLPLGAIASNIIFKGSGIRQRVQEFRDSRLAPGWQLSETVLFRVVIFASIILCPIFFSVLSGDSALSEALTTGDIVTSQTIRRETRSEINIPLFDLFFSTGTIQWLSYIAIAMALAVKSVKWWILSSVLFAVMIYLSVVDASVSKILYYLIGILFIRSLLGGTFIKWYEAIGLVVLLELMFVLFKGSDQGFIANVLGPVLGRVVFGQMVGTYLSLEIFPYAHEFIGFSSTGRVIHDLMGLPFSENYGLVMMGIYRPTAVDLGYAGHLTTMFMGEAWANFGLWGIIFGPLWVGFFVQSINLLFIKGTKNAVSLALYVYLAITFGYHSDIMGFYYPFGTATFVIGCLFIVVVGRFLVGAASEPRTTAIHTDR